MLKISKNSAVGRSPAAGSSGVRRGGKISSKNNYSAGQNHPFEPGLMDLVLFLFEMGITGSKGGDVIDCSPKYLFLNVFILVVLSDIHRLIV